MHQCIGSGSWWDQSLIYDVRLTPNSERRCVALPHWVFRPTGMLNLVYLLFLLSNPLQLLTFSSFENAKMPKTGPQDFCDKNDRTAACCTAVVELTDGSMVHEKLVTTRQSKGRKRNCSCREIHRIANCKTLSFLESNPIFNNNIRNFIGDFSYYYYLSLFSSLVIIVASPPPYH
jgi:hypothetical protein